MINNLGGLIAAKQNQFKKKVSCRTYKAYLSNLDFHSYKFYDPNVRVSWHNYIIR